MVDGPLSWLKNFFKNPTIRSFNGELPRAINKCIAYILLFSIAGIKAPYPNRASLKPTINMKHLLIYSWGKLSFLKIDFTSASASLEVTFFLVTSPVAQPCQMSLLFFASTMLTVSVPSLNGTLYVR